MLRQTEDGAAEAGAEGRGMGKAARRQQYFAWLAAAALLGAGGLVWIYARKDNALQARKASQAAIAGYRPSSSSSAASS